MTISLWETVLKVRFVQPYVILSVLENDLVEGAKYLSHMASQNREVYHPPKLENLKYRVRPAEAR